MEDRKPADSSSVATSPLCPSSISADLFGRKESSTSVKSSSSGIFNSVFPPASMIVGKDSSQFDSLGPWEKKAPELKVSNAQHMSSDIIEEGCETENKNVLNKDKISVHPQEAVEPCIFGSSLHYGGRDIFSHSNTEAPVAPAIFKKTDWDEDPNASNANSASRGNWWQGYLKIFDSLLIDNLQSYK